MLHAFHYEPQGQRQQFEPREAQENLKQRQMHLHFSLDLHLNLGARLRRASRSTIGRVTTIFAAFMGALALALSPYWTQAHGVQTPPTLDTLFSLAGHLVFAGVLLGVGTVLLGGIPLVVSAWRTRPRSRILFLLPILASLPAIACSLLSAFIMLLSNQPPPFFPILPSSSSTVEPWSAPSRSTAPFVKQGLPTGGSVWPIISVGWWWWGWF